MKNLDLFGQAAKQKRPRALLMHVIDGGENAAGMPIAQFLCRRCAFESPWVLCNVSQGKKGCPCPQCNPMMLPLHYEEGDELICFECPKCRYMEHILRPTTIQSEWGIVCPQCAQTVLSKLKH